MPQDSRKQANQMKKKRKKLDFVSIDCHYLIILRLAFLE